MQLSLVVNNSAPQGTNLYLAAGSTTTYMLPAPPGYWVPATKCEIWREGCRCSTGAITCSERTNCEAAESLCKMDLTQNTNFWNRTTASICRPATFNQPCDWQNNPALLGEVAYTLPLGSHNDALPTACSVGLLGGNGSDLSEQSSAKCAGFCPAGFVCGGEATVEPTPCPTGHFCPGGTSTAQPCSEGTHSNTTKLIDATQCMAADPGFYAPTGSTEQTPCAPGTAQPSSGMRSCVKCEAGTYQDKEGQLSCSICGIGSYSANVLSCELCQVGEYCPVDSVVGTPCPTGSTTEGRGAKSPSACGCPAATYDATAGDEIDCQPCTDDMQCTLVGLNLATVHLAPSHWRHSNRTKAIYKCDTAGNTSASPCLGGADSACLDGHEGPRCEWCSDPSLYYDDISAKCKDCGNVAAYAAQQVGVLLAMIIVFALLRVVLVRMPRLLTRISSKLVQLAIAVQQFGLQAKRAMRIQTPHTLS